LIASTFIKNPDPKNKIEVNHKNGNKVDNRIENLEGNASELEILVALKNKK
jgi:hypothetical protein